MDATTFRTDFPEFANTTAYPDAQVTFWIGIAGKLLNPCRWNDMLDVGTELFVAHNLVLERMAAKSAATGALPGITQGPVASKAVDKVSIAYDVDAGIEQDAGHWNETSFGRRFINFARMMGAGGMQL